MIYRRLLFAMFVGIFGVLHCAWLENIPTQLYQPDGTFLDVFSSGDEFHNWVHCEREFTMVEDKDTGYWCWARESDDGDIISTRVPVHQQSPESLGLSPKVNISEEVYRRKREARDAHNRNTRSRAPSKGVIDCMTIFIRFQGETEFPGSVQYYDSLLNSTGPNVQSMKQYFWDVSYGQLEVNSPLLPTPMGANIISYEDIMPRNYYQPYNANTNPNGYIDDYTHPLYNNTTTTTYREHNLLKRAIDYVNENGMIDPSWDIDSDGNGFVDNVNFIVRGGTGAWADLLWPHRWTLYGATAMIGNLRVWDYNFNIEAHLAESGVSVLAHEFTHSMGVPDFYRYYHTAIAPVARWCLMAQNTTPPQAINAYIKDYYLNWIRPIRTITSNETVTLYPSSIYGSIAAEDEIEECIVRINSPYSTGPNSQYFLVEYRSRTTGNTIDSALPGSGLIIWRVNSARAGSGSNGGYGNSPSPDELYAYRPNGTTTNNGNVNSAHFSAQVNRTMINDNTNPNSFLIVGSSLNMTAGGLNIRNIGEAGESITFFVDVQGADPEAITESWENGVLTDYDWFCSPTAWQITDAEAFHGDFSIASPEIDDGQSARLETTVKMDAGYFQFRVKTSTEAGNDVLRFFINGIEQRSWSGETAWTHYTAFLGEGTYTFAWVYQKDASGSAGADKVWIDAIGFPPLTGHILYPASNITSTTADMDVTLSWDAPYRTSMTEPTPVPELLGYNIYRNNVLLNDEIVPERTYTLYNTTGGNMIFWVVAVYDQGESAESPRHNVVLPFSIPVNLQANYHSEGVIVTWEFPYPQTSLHGFRVSRNDISITASNQPANQFSYIDRTGEIGETYFYRVRAVYVSPPGMSDWSEKSEEIVYLNDEDIVVSLPTGLRGNYPNPFNPSTTISFSVGTRPDSSASPVETQYIASVHIDIYNIKGQRVRQLVNSEYPIGIHSVVWNGTDDAGLSVGSGVYFYRMKTEGYSETKKMILMK